MYKEFRFLPTIQIRTWLKRLRELGRRKIRTLFYIGGSDVLPAPLDRKEETRLLKEYAYGNQIFYINSSIFKFLCYIHH